MSDVGRDDIAWPGTTVEHWWRTRRLRTEDFRLVPPRLLTNPLRGEQPRSEGPTGPLSADPERQVRA
jgi:hypothetical protein